MASITPILGTDSLSSSRIVINNNFESIRTELSDVASLLNTADQTLTLTGAVTASRLTLVSGASNLFTVNGTDIISSLKHTFEAGVVFEGSLVGSVYGTDLNPATALPTAGAWSHETYFVETGSYIMTTGLQGQNVTLVAATGGDLTINKDEISGQTVDLVITDGTTLSFRFLGTKWYIV